MNLPVSRRRFLNTSLLGVSAALLARPLRTFAADTPAPSKPPSAKLTMLSAMAGSDFEVACRRHAEIGLQWLDLKDGLFGENINTLSLDNARRAAAIARDHGLKVFCFSTALCESEVNVGESAFRARHLPTLDHVLQVADILEPTRIRLIGARLKPFPKNESTIAVVERDHPWTIGVYREMVDRIAASGRRVLIENETGNVILNRPEAILRFFELLDRSDKARYTWDVQNLWETGVFPSLDVYRQLRPVIGCLHLKGGRTEGDGKTLAYASSLADASWPVVDIVGAAVRDGVAPFLCLNPSHGKRPPGYKGGWDATRGDVAFLRQNISADL
ncbi:MAG: TIM barrel protein [Burkholderiales bacterium]|nr:TIM barrel protein [Opitutaceae bacterium]